MSLTHYVVEGIVLKIDDTQTFKNNFKKREIVIITEDQFPEEIKFEFTDENGILVLDQFIEGEKVKIAFLIKGNSYQGRHFVNLRGIAIASVIEEDGKKVVKTKTKKEDKKEIVSSDDDDEDDLPF